MKRLLHIIPVFAAVVIIFLLAACEEDTTCKARIICRYTETGLDTLGVVDSVTVVFGKETFAEFAQDTGYTNRYGMYETTFRYESLLEINAFCVKIDSTDGVVTEHRYVGKNEIKLIPGETVERIVLMMPQ